MAQLYCKDTDLERMKRLAEREVRPPVDQFTVVLDHYARLEGLDPETMSPLDGEQGKNGRAKSAGKS